MQTQTSNNLHNAIMEAGSKDRPPMLAPGNYVQLKSRIKRLIETKPNHELIHHCLKNPPYKFTWADKEVPISEGSPVIRTESHMETYKTVSQDIHDQLNAEAEAHQNEVNEIRAERIARVANPLALVAQQQPVNRGKAIANSPQPINDQEPSMVAEDDEMSNDKEIDKLMTLISLSFKKIYKPTNNNLQTSSNASQANQDNSPRINRSTRYENQRIGNVAGARETVGSTVVQKYRIQCYNCKEFGHVARECQKPKRVKDVAYHREKMLLYQELEAHYMYMAKLQEVSLDAADSGPIFDAKPLEQIDQNDDDADLVHEQLVRRNDVEYASKVEIDCAKAKGDLISYKMKSQKSFNKYSQMINDLNQTISKMKEKLCAHQETISIMSQQKETQIKLYKTREDKELDKVIALENKASPTPHGAAVVAVLSSDCHHLVARNRKILGGFKMSSPTVVADPPPTAAAAVGKAAVVAAVGVAVVLVVSSGGCDDGVMEAAGGIVSVLWWCRLPWCVGEGGVAAAEMVVVG
nr:hypothetical protein [Tanacetum cinerariifolium]